MEVDDKLGERLVVYAEMVGELRGDLRDQGEVLQVLEVGECVHCGRPGGCWGGVLCVVSVGLREGAGAWEFEMRGVRVGVAVS